MSLRENISNSVSFTVINKYGKGVVVEIETVFWHVYHVALWQKGSLKRDFLDIYLTPSFGIRSFGNT